MLKLSSKSICIVALIGYMVLDLPILAIFQKTEGRAMNGSSAIHRHDLDQTVKDTGHSSKLPVNCPVMDFRTGLALLSLKPASKFTFKAPIGIGPIVTKQPLPAHSWIEIRNNLPSLEPRLSFLGILRI